MGKDITSLADGTWRQGLLQRLEDINTELERQAPRVLAEHAERCETPSAYQRQCQDILEKLRQDCAVIEADGSPPAANPPAPVLSAADGFGAAPTSLRSDTGDIGYDDEADPDEPAITNESILAYANSSSLLAETTALRLKVGFWVAGGACLVVAASASALLVSSILDAGPDTRKAATVHQTTSQVGSSAPKPEADRGTGTTPLASVLAWLTGASATSPANAAGTSAPAALASQAQKPGARPRPQLIADMPVRRADARAIPLALRLEGASHGEFERHVVLIRDLPEAATVGAGRRVGPRTWAVPPSMMEKVTLGLPDDVAETVDLRVELVDPAGEPLTRTRLRLRLIEQPKPEAAEQRLAAIHADQAERQRLNALIRESIDRSRAAAEAAAREEAAKVQALRAEAATAVKPSRLAKTSEEADEEADEAPKPKATKKAQSAKSLARPSALGAPPSQPLPATGSVAPAPPASAKLPKRLIGAGPEWSPFRKDATDSRN